ncbi:Myc-type, basic helix-loop-helix (bHLH) domain containing protein [Trema orientale]|uniref:Myc-type, basic helix-loop-helix (BHLH) domain containing protein n=1 Tax=Trema orientale TaxID=63057 RepID=A0A2P5FP63_TREOI|nr:Myc-type, basic helix-loop-helix (bHLH) domain containing protein [Trema orientale]
MEYRNLHSQNQLQDQVTGRSSLPTGPQSGTARITSTRNNWNPSMNFLNHGTTLYPTDETIPNSRLWPSSPVTRFTTQDLVMSSSSSSSTTTDHARGFNQRISAHNESSWVPNIKKEPPDFDFDKLRINNISSTPYSDLDESNYLISTMYKQNQHNIIGLSNSSTVSSGQILADDQDFYSVNAQSNNNNINASFGAGFTGHHVAATNGYDDDLGHVFSIRTTSSTGTSLLSSPSLMLASGGFNLQALDLLMSPTSSTTYRSQSFSPSSHSSYNNHNLSLYSQSSSTSLGHGHHDMQDYSRSSPSNSSNMTSAFLNEVTRSTKRPSSSSFSEPKEYSRAESKKSKSMLRTSNPPLKVRKEKLGDRIAALHRLVAPFGKTDTASVLTEAIGYIQFLHDQVQTLSMPYMKSLQTKSSRKMQQVHGLSKEEETDQLNKMDLRSRGLCLVPQSCASYLNGFD